MEKLPKEENDFYAYMNKLTELYDKNPKKVTKEMREALVRLNALEDIGVFDGVDFDKLFLCILAIFIAGIGLVNIPNIPIYLFGVVFFLAGHFIGLYVNVFGLIFLFSHSVTGICVMEGALIGSILQSPIMSDNPQNIYIYLAINFSILIIATLIVIFHNLSMGFRAKRHVVLIPMAIYAVGFLMSAILPFVVDKLYLL